MKKNSILGRRPAFAVVLATTAICVLAPGASPVQGTADKIDSARAVLEKYVETRRVLSKEKRDWALGREMLEERIDLVTREIESLRAKIDEAQKSIAATDEKRMALIGEKERLEKSSALLARSLADREARTKKLLGRLPEPLLERVKPLSQQIPEQPEDSKLSLGKRFQFLVGILNEANKFNGDISLTSEVRAISDGVMAEVTAMYVGISRGYYVTSDATASGVGTATPEGWVWRSANEAAPDIAQAIAILKDEKPASFVPLPVRITNEVR